LKAKGILVFDEDGLLGADEARAQIDAARDPGKAYMQAVNDRQRIAAGRLPLQPASPPARASWSSAAWSTRPCSRPSACCRTD